MSYIKHFIEELADKLGKNFNEVTEEDMQNHFISLENRREVAPIENEGDLPTKDIAEYSYFELMESGLGGENNKPGDIVNIGGIDYLLV